MHQDQKIGLSLAVLLIGFTGAFCFRHEPLLGPQSLVLDRADELDLRIEHLPLRAYTEREGVALPGEGGNGHRPLAADGPLSDVLEIGRSPQAATAAAHAGRRDVIPLFAGPPEPLRIAQQEAPNRPARSLPKGAPNSPTHTARRLTGVPNGPQSALVTARDHGGDPAAAHPVLAVGSDSSARHVPSVMTYKVRSGDTLSGLAQRFLGSSRRYHELYEANRDVLSSPHALREGMVLRMPAER